MQIGAENFKSVSGFLPLYRGVLPPLMIAGVVSSVNFGVYQGIKNAFEKANSQSSSELPLPVHAAAGAGAGAVISVITSPANIIKVQQQALGTGLVQTASRLVRVEGTRGLFRGFGAHFIGESFGRGVYMMIYEALKRVVLARQPDSWPTNAHRIIAGAGAGMGGWFVIYPVDVIRSRIFALQPGSRGATGMAECASQVYRDHGYRGFFKGLGLTMMRAGPVAAVVLPAYDLIFEFLQSRDVLGFLQGSPYYL